MDFFVEKVARLLALAYSFVRGDYCVSVTLSSSVSNESEALSGIHEYLRSCFDLSPQIPLAVYADWDEIGSLVFAQVDSVKDSSFKAQEKYFSERLKAFRLIVRKLSDFRTKYSDYMGDVDIQIFDKYSRLAASGVAEYEGKALFCKAILSNSFSERLTNFRDGLRLYSASVPVFLEAHIALLEKGKLTHTDLDNYLSYVRSLCIEIIQIVDNTSKPLSGGFQPVSKKDGQKREEIEIIIKSMFWDLSQISQGRKPLDYILVLIDGTNVALDAHSAEGKAIQRVHNPLSPEEWEVSYKPGDEVNISEIRNRLKKRVNG